MARQAGWGGSGSVQMRVSDLRAKLLALEYHDPFTPESLALVERLFADLVTTTESYEDLQQRVSVPGVVSTNVVSGEPAPCELMLGYRLGERPVASCLPRHTLPCFHLTFIATRKMHRETATPARARARSFVTRVRSLTRTCCGSR